MAVGAGLALRGRVLLMVAVAGVLDASANLMFAAGSQRGLTSVVAVLGSLYPVTTVALAAVILHERLGRLQAVGAGFALAGRRDDRRRLALRGTTGAPAGGRALPSDDGSGSSPTPATSPATTRRSTPTRAPSRPSRAPSARPW